MKTTILCYNSIPLQNYVPSHVTHMGIEPGPLAFKADALTTELSEQLLYTNRFVLESCYLCLLVNSGLHSLVISVATY